MVVAELSEPPCTCRVRGRCGGCERVSEEKSELGGQRVVRTPGVGVGSRAACGARARKRVNCRRDKASAMLLEMPGKC